MLCWALYPYIFPPFTTTILVAKGLGGRGGVGRGRGGRPREGVGGGGKYIQRGDHVGQTKQYNTTQGGALYVLLVASVDFLICF